MTKWKMEIDKDDMRILYTNVEGINRLVDKIINNILTKLGYEFIGSGFNFKTKIRDL